MTELLTKTMTHPIWWKEEVIYQIYPKSFRDSNGDGIGDLRGITEKLDYLSRLGITTIWICPIFKSPMVDNGYDISDYQDINPEFGTMEDFDELLKEAKKREMKIILDLVVNHTSDEHRWFKEAIKNPKSKYRQYYIFKKGNEGNPPNNWRSIFGGSVWEPVPGEEDMFYFHSFDKRQPDLDWENPAVRQEVYDMINWWLEKGISGFRVDSITFIKKDQDYASLSPDGADGLASVKHKGRNRPGIADFLKELNQKTFQNYQCVTVGEAPGVGYEEFDQYIGEDGYFNMIFDFHYADIDVESGSEWFRRTNWTVSEFKEKIFASQQALQDNGWGANFLENHDQPRSISKYIRDKNYQNSIGAKALGVLFFFLRGTPFIYQGQEIGMDNFNRTSIDMFNDVSSIDNFHRSILEGYSNEEALNFVNLRSRDNGRTPFHWIAEKHGGFSEASPWIEMADEKVEMNAGAQELIEDSVLSFYKEMIQLRNHSEYKNTLIYGEFTPIKTSEEIIGYKRAGEEEIELYVNFSSQHTKVKASGEVLLSNYERIERDKHYLNLAPYQAILIRKAG